MKPDTEKTTSVGIAGLILVSAQMGAARPVLWLPRSQPMMLEFQKKIWRFWSIDFLSKPAPGKGCLTWEFHLRTNSVSGDLETISIAMGVIRAGEAEV